MPILRKTDNAISFFQFFAIPGMTLHGVSVRRIPSRCQNEPGPVVARLPNHEQVIRVLRHCCLLLSGITLRAYCTEAKRAHLRLVCNEVKQHNAAHANDMKRIVYIKVVPTAVFVKNNRGLSHLQKLGLNIHQSFNLLISIQIDYDELILSLRKLDDNVKSGPDLILPFFRKRCIPSLANPIIQLFNFPVRLENFFYSRHFQVG